MKKGVCLLWERHCCIPWNLRWWCDPSPYCIMALDTVSHREEGMVKRVDKEKLDDVGMMMLVAEITEMVKKQGRIHWPSSSWIRSTSLHPSMRRLSERWRGGLCVRC